MTKFYKICFFLFISYLTKRTNKVHNFLKKKESNLKSLIIIIDVLYKTNKGISKMFPKH